MTTCRVCRKFCEPLIDEERLEHQGEHTKLSMGQMPRAVLEFIKAVGWNFAHNDVDIRTLKDKFDPEVGKLTAVYSWWNRARAHGIKESDFDKFMESHLQLADAFVSNDPAQIEAAGRAIEPWARFAG
jgi:hypothetical protein